MSAVAVPFDARGTAPRTEWMPYGSIYGPTCTASHMYRCPDVCLKDVRFRKAHVVLVGRESE
jgi:hypothetical protein